MEPGILHVLVRGVSIFSAAPDYVMNRHESWCTVESWKFNDMSKSFRGLNCVFSVNSALTAKYSFVMRGEVKTVGNYTVLSNVALCSQEEINILLVRPVTCLLTVTHCLNVFINQLSSINNGLNIQNGPTPFKEAC
jgi:hypothetical protein